jgi:hypothetical protein
VSNGVLTFAEKSLIATLQAVVIGLCLLIVAVAFGSVQAQTSPPQPHLEVVPARISLRRPSDRQQIVVSLLGADGVATDMTRRAHYSIHPPTIAGVSESGLVTSLQDGAATLVVSLEGATRSIGVQVSDATKQQFVSYRNDVSPILSKAGCNMGACHGNLNGKGGFRLSLRADDPDSDFLALTRDQFGRRIDPGAPDRSLIVLKPTGQLPHEGGVRFHDDSIEAIVLKRWVAEGAHDDGKAAVEPTKLHVYPEKRIQAPRELLQQLVVTAAYEDGSTRDVTRQAAFDINDPSLAEISPDGLVRVKGPTEITIGVRLGRARAVSRLAVLADRPGFVWSNPPSNNRVDDLVFAKLRELRINPSPLSNDSVFLRRVYLDLIGRLPDPQDVRKFLADRDPAKRSRLIDTLIDRPEFADFWALKWADLLRNEEKVMGEKGVWIFQRWLRDQIASDRPLDAMVREIVSTTGSTWRNPASSFHRTNRDPMTAAETVGQVFLGIRLQCARCHNHPFDVWTQDDYYGLAAYFANVSRKQVSNRRRDMLDKHEINSDEFVFLKGQPQIANPRTGKMLGPKAPFGPSLLSSHDLDALDDLATWLTVDNPQFVRNLANRIWYHLLGRGIVDPVDDFRDSNPPSIPALLDALAAELRTNGMRIKPLVALIAKSRIYQLSATPEPSNAEDVTNFSHAAVRLNQAEVLFDTIGQVLAVPQRFEKAPQTSRSVQLAGVKSGSPFLQVFGKPDRLLTCECERSDATTLAQAFQMINGDTIREKLQAPGNRIASLITSGTESSEILEELYLSALCRLPNSSERDAMLKRLHDATDRRAAWEDICWALLNCKEFLLRH